MKAVGKITKSDIGRFRSMDGLKLHKRIQRVQEQVESIREVFLKSDGSAEDHNSDDGVVLLDRAKTSNAGGISGMFSKTAQVSGLLDDESGKLEAEKTSSHTYFLGGKGGKHSFKTKFLRSENEDKIQWAVTQANTMSAHPKSAIRTGMMVVENKSAGTLTLFQG